MESLPLLFREECNGHERPLPLPPLTAATQLLQHGDLDDNDDDDDVGDAGVCVKNIPAVLLLVVVGRK